MRSILICSNLRLSSPCRSSLFWARPTYRIRPFSSFPFIASTACVTNQPHTHIFTQHTYSLQSENTAYCRETKITLTFTGGHEHIFIVSTKGYHSYISTKNNHTLHQGPLLQLKSLQTLSQYYQQTKQNWLTSNKNAVFDFHYFDWI